MLPCWQAKHAAMLASQAPYHAGKSSILPCWQAKHAAMLGLPPCLQTKHFMEEEEKVASLEHAAMLTGKASCHSDK
jgi:hypothetical protein